jgi:hypothetical protein
MRNVKYRTDFILKCLINIGIFIYFFAFSRDPIVLILLIMNTYYVVSTGVKIHKEKGWRQIYRKHDQRTKSNTYFAGYISMWFMMVALIVGGISVRYGLLPIDSFELIYGIFLGGVIVMLFVRHYLNGDEFQ